MGLAAEEKEGSTMQTFACGDYLPQNYMIVSIVHPDELAMNDRVLLTADSGENCEGSVLKVAFLPNDCFLYHILLDSRTWKSQLVPIA
jgi:hypothetical protein